MKHPKTSQRIRECLDENNMTQQELSSSSGVSKASVNHYVSGLHKPSYEAAEKMSAVLKVSPLWLMGYDIDKHYNC